MKIPFFKPGFEFVFALSLIAILGLPPMLMAQDQKDIEIKIQNGDTTVNGKSIKDLTPAERKTAMKDIRHISADIASNGPGETRALTFRRDTATGGRHKMMTNPMTVKRDSAGNIVEMRSGRRLGRITEDGEGPGEMGFKPGRAGDPFRPPMMGYGRRNSQSFNYVNTDNNGISTRISFNVADVTNEDLKRMPHIEGARLEINDLNLVPEFSTGKTIVLFTLQTKGAAEVKMVNSEGKIMWTEKTNAGMFTKSFVMGLNGIYYLQVKQGSGVAVKRIMKEE